MWQFSVGAGGLLTAKSPASVATAGAIVGVVTAGPVQTPPALGRRVHAAAQHPDADRADGDADDSPGGGGDLPVAAQLHAHARPASARRAVLLNGRRLAVRTCNGVWTVRIDLRGREKGTVIVRIRARRPDGSRHAQTRRFRTCEVGD